MINPKLLAAFVEVGELRSFRAAADRLNRSQSALSMQIRDLEEQLGVSLFQRTTRSVEVTPEGECLLECVKRALHELDEGLNRVKTLRTQHRGKVRVACVPSVAGTRLPKVISRFQQDYPSVQVEVFELLAKRVHEAVVKRSADLGIGPVSAHMDGLNSDALFVEPVCAVFSPNTARRASRGITLRDLQGLPVMTTGIDTIQRDMLDRAQLTMGIRLKITHQVAQAQTLLRMVSAGLGVAIVPEIAMEAPGYDALHAYPIVSPPMTRELAIITRRDQSLTSSARRFARTLKETLATA